MDDLDLAYRGFLNHYALLYLLKFHFDLTAPIYEFLLGNELPEKMDKLIDPSDSDIILEVGGGTGRIIQNYIGTAGELWLIDPSVPMLKEAQTRYPALNLVRGYAEDLPFPTSYVDQIIVFDSLHHWDDYDMALKEMYRVLKPGGELFIAEIHPNDRRGYYIDLMERLFQMQSKFFTTSQLINMLKTQSFTVLSVGWLDPPTYYIKAGKPNTKVSFLELLWRDTTKPTTSTVTNDDITRSRLIVWQAERYRSTNNSKL